MAKVLVLADESSPDVAARARTLLGDGHDYKVIAISPDRHSPFLDDATTSDAQGDVDREYAGIAEQAAGPVGGNSEVRSGNPAMEIVEAAREEGADILVVEGNRPGLWGRLTQRSPAEYALSHAPCAVLFLPKDPPR